MKTDSLSGNNLVRFPTLTFRNILELFFIIHALYTTRSQLPFGDRPVT